MEDKQNNVPALVAGGSIRAIVPQNIEELYRMAKGIVVAGIVPDSYKGRTTEETTSKVAIGLQKSLEVGLPPLTGLGNIMIVNGKPSIWGDAAVALIQSKGVVDYIEQKYEGSFEEGTLTAIYKIKRKGQEEPYVCTFSLDDARRAKLLTKPGPWIMYPKRMLMNRARAWALRDGFADCLSGLAIAEEIKDIHVKNKEVDKSFLDDTVESLVVDERGDIIIEEETITDDMVALFKSEQQSDFLEE